MLRHPDSYNLDRGPLELVNDLSQLKYVPEVQMGTSVETSCHDVPEVEAKAEEDFLKTRREAQAQIYELVHQTVRKLGVLMTRMLDLFPLLLAP